jgi:hypothetical protein
VLPVAAFVTVALIGGALAGIASYLLLERPMLQFMRGRQRATPIVRLDRAAAAEN